MPPKRWIVITAAAFFLAAAASVVWITAARAPAQPPMAALETAGTNPPGWEWLMPPQDIGDDRPVRAVWLSDRTALTVVGTDPDDMYASVTRFGPVEEAPLETAFRLIEITADGRRRHGRCITATWHPDGRSVAVYRLNFDDDEPARTAMLGLEVCPPEGKRLIAREAVAAAAAEGIAVPALPQIGQPYEFQFTDVDGAVICSSDYCGQVVLLNIWATWCGPCMAKLPQLKQVYEQYHGSGLQIVAVSLDQDVADPVRVYAEQGIEWPLVFVPADDTTRDLWRRATDTTGIPRVLLIDREGVLQGDLHGANLAGRVGSYFQEAVAAGGTGAVP